jgi:hypothetical protein
MEPVTLIQITVISSVYFIIRNDELLPGVLDVLTHFQSKSSCELACYRFQ